MSDPQDKWMALLQQLATGSKVAWDTQDIANDAEQNLLEQLQQIEKIQQAFAIGQTPSSGQAEPMPEAMFEWGHLLVTAPLGGGSYGEVFRAYDPVLNREVALKLLKPDQLAAFHSKLFIEEAQRIARVRNRHVLAIHGAGVHDGRAGFWADLIEGQTLSHRTQVGQAECLSVATALADALQAVHEAGLVHGDVKAANVMQDQRGQYVLMDFGAGLEHGTINSNNHSVGSPMLMAPELFVAQPKSPASDIYALGCLLFKLITDQYPVQGQHVLDIAQAHQEGAYTPLSAWRVDLSRSMQQLLQEMIDPVPHNRPSAAACVARLERIRTEPRRRKKRRLVLGIMASLALGLVLATGGLLVANAQREKAEIERQKAQTVNDFLQQILVSASRFGQGREVRVADMLDVAAKNKRDNFADQPHAMVAISEALGRSYQNLQLNDKSLAEFSDQVNMTERLYGAQHPASWEARLHQAKIQSAMGLNQPSEQTIEAVIEETRGLPEQHNLHQYAVVEKANLLTDQGALAAAESLFQQVIQTQPKAGQTAPNYLFLAMTGLASNYNRQAKYTAALQMAEQAHALLLADPKHKKTNEMVVFNVQGIALIRLGRFAEAEQVMRQNLAMAEVYYGQKNFGYLRLLTNHASVLSELKKQDEALLQLEKALALSAEVAGQNRRFRLVLTTNLANALVATGDLAAGEQMMRESLVNSTDILGPDDIQTLMLEYNLAELLNQRSQHAVAKDLSQASLSKAIDALGEAHLITLLVEDNLAVSLKGLGDVQSAAAQHVALLPRIQQAFGSESVHVHLVWQHTVDSLLAAGQRDQALAQQQALLAVLQQTHGPDHPEVQMATARLANLLPVEQPP